ncbi:MAG: hypothetical protein AAGG45_02240 [Pseudomonadota bacterium]
MSRDVDERKKRKALRKLRKAAELAEQGLGPPLSDWEREFLEEVEARIEKYGSAFHDPEKGASDEPLSVLQTVKLKEIDKKARGKSSGFKQRKPLGSKKKSSFTPRVRRLDEERSDEGAKDLSRPMVKPKLVSKASGEAKESPRSSPKSRKARPVLRVIKGGTAKD